MRSAAAGRKGKREMAYPFHFFRSPGSKCWFIPRAEQFVREVRPKTIVEPFAGSGVVGLTLLNHGYCDRLVIAEKDPARHAFWEAALNDATLHDRAFRWIREVWAQPVEKQADFVKESLTQMETSDPPFFALLKALSSFNGIVHGRNSTNGLRPIRNWLPETLDSSLQFVYEARGKIELLSDAFDALRRTDSPDSYAFVDPPYSAGRKSPGHLLYRESEIDHEALFHVLGKWRGSWQLTSEFCAEMRRHLRLAAPVLGAIRTYAVPMRTGHGRKKVELVISRNQGNNGSAGS